MLNIKKDFPALKQKIHDQDFVYLDSAATTLKPQRVIDTISHFNSYETFNVHRGSHFLGQRITQKFEESREVIKNFLGAESSDEIIFTKGTTEGLNLIAHSLGQDYLQDGDTILLTLMEHHANIVPWQMLASRKKIKIEYIDLLPDGSLDEKDFEKKLMLFKPKVVSFTASSNVLGTLTPIEKIVEKARQIGAITIVDGAQIVSQHPVNMQNLKCDFFVFSAHKLFGPMGFGVVYGKKSLLQDLPPYQGGGSMIAEVFSQHSSWNVLPFKFEAGTPHIEGALGTAEAIKYLHELGFENIKLHKDKLTQLVFEQFKRYPEVELYGTATNKSPIFAFNLKGAHHSDVAQLLDQQGVAVRAGHHCAQPLLKWLNRSGSVRASFSIYNNELDVEKFFMALNKAKGMLL